MSAQNREDVDFAEAIRTTNKVNAYLRTHDMKAVVDQIVKETYEDLTMAQSPRVSASPIS